MNGEQLEFSWTFPSSQKAGRLPQTPIEQKGANPSLGIRTQTNRAWRDGLQANAPMPGLKTGNP
jgi:hypothetical protein